ncbi:MAG: phosphate ABC transporter permease subunit PstC [Gammaproteobacteria bacterium]|jgi:phosphate transport system permease protein|nr:phosphate ABC transporter permease subunit PstC [Gammaproteobacteria bacterium]
MQAPTIIIALLILSSVSYYLGRKRAFAVAQGHIRKLHSLPLYYGLYTAIWAGVPALLLLAFWFMFEDTMITHLVVADLPAHIADQGADRLNLVINDIKNMVNGNIVSSQINPAMQAAADHYKQLQSTSHILVAIIALCLAVGSGSLMLTKIKAKQRARNAVESFLTVVLILCSSIAILTTIGILLSVLFESIRFFRAVPITEFIFGLEWSPQTAIRADQVGSSGAFGAVPLFAGTLLISFIAMLVAVPIGLMSAIFLSEYAGPKVRATAKPLLEILAGIPTVVYGFFAALSVAPFIRDTGGLLGLDVASESALAAGLVMGIMIIPFVSSLSDDVINAVPQSLRDGAYGLGATQSETIRRVIFPAALPGIVGGILLAVSRAIGETMIVVMAAGLAANLTANPLEAVTTVTVQIVTLLTGDQEFDSPKTLAAFALGLMLFTVTLVLNVIALHVVRKYREQYE